MRAMILREGVITSYDPVKRQIRVKVAETATADTQPLADIMYPLGDNPNDTEIYLKEGDLVWCTFLTDDFNYPIIVGFRCPQTGNLLDIRRIRQKNIELLAVERLKGSGTTILYEATEQAKIIAPDIQLEGQVKVIGSAETTGNMRVGTGRTTIATSADGQILSFMNGILI